MSLYYLWAICTYVLTDVAYSCALGARSLDVVHDCGFSWGWKRVDFQDIPPAWRVFVPPEVMARRDELIVMRYSVTLGLVSYHVVADQDGTILGRISDYE